MNEFLSTTPAALGQPLRPLNVFRLAESRSRFAESETRGGFFCCDWRRSLDHDAKWIS